jgi:hypothetical protein
MFFLMGYVGVELFDCAATNELPLTPAIQVANRRREP